MFFNKIKKLNDKIVVEKSKEKKIKLEMSLAKIITKIYNSKNSKIYNACIIMKCSKELKESIKSGVDSMISLCKNNEDCLKSADIGKKIILDEKPELKDLLEFYIKLMYTSLMFFNDLKTNERK